MQIREEKLIPYALQRIADSVDKTNVDSDEFVERLAEELFQTHRGSGQTKFRSKVQERTWREIPNSQKGRYRAMVREALSKRPKVKTK